MPSRWTSRKFLTTLIAQLAALAVLLFPEHTDQITRGAESLAALAVLLVSALGYTAAEASVDRSHRKERAPRVNPSLAGEPRPR